jgi:hypothetical protein
MGLLDLLRSLGDRLGILESAAAKTSRPLEKVPTRTITLAELKTTIRSEEVRMLAGLPAEFSVAFEEIFKAAGIKSGAHGWSVERLAGLLRTEQFKSMERPAVQKAILNILDEEKVEVEDLVREAVGRDQALDAYEGFVQRKMEARMAAWERNISELESEIRALEEKRARVRAEVDSDGKHWRQWLDKKRAHEKELAWTIGYLIDRPVITIEEE